MNIQRFLRPARPLALLALLALSPLAEAARLALVIGNDAYQNVSPLRNARNDAQALARELEAAGFKVTRLLDGTRQTMNTTLDGFLQRVGKGDEVVFFFSGHGSQPSQGSPMLLPVDIQPTSERVVMRDGVALNQVMDDLNQRARFALLIIDACRDDPFRQTSFGRSIAPGSSLGRIEPPSGTMVIMAASKGQQALDRLSDRDPVPNGLFTRELIRHMRTPGLSASEMMRRVKTSVEQAAAGVNHVQRPALVDESSSDFFFYPAQGSAQPVPAGTGGGSQRVAPVPDPTPVRPAQTYTPPAQPYTPPAQPYTPPAPVVAPAAPQPVPGGGALPVVTSRTEAQREFDAWEAATRSPTRASFEGFLSQFPNGRYAAQARSRLAGMGGAAPVAAPVQAPAKPNPQAEFEYWERITARGTREAYQEYLRTYPNGRYADIARARSR